MDERLERIADDAAAIIVEILREWIEQRLAGHDGGLEGLHARVRAIVGQAIAEAVNGA